MKSTRRNSALAGIAGAALALSTLTSQAGPLTDVHLSATGQRLDSRTAVVGGEREFTSFSGAYGFDFSDDGQLSIGTLNFYDISLGNSPVNSYVFSDASGTAPDIVGVRLLGMDDVSGFDASDITFTANAITLALGGTHWGSTGKCPAAD